MSDFKAIVVRRRKRRSFFEGLIHRAMGHAMIIDILVDGLEEYLNISLFSGPKKKSIKQDTWKLDKLQQRTKSQLH